MAEQIERRYEGNADGSIARTHIKNRYLFYLSTMHQNINMIRNNLFDKVSTRSQTLREFNLSSHKSSKSQDIGDIKQKVGGQYDELTRKEKLNDLYLGIKAKLKALITDQWRRATQSGNDPYVKISLKPTPDNCAEESFCTLPILGGGTNVAFDAVYDNAEYTFLCRKDINALTRKYLKIEVFDQETATSDRLIGTAHILLKKMKENIDETQFATVSLYGDCDTDYQWSGTVEIGATFKKIDLEEVETISFEINQRIEQNMKKKLGIINKISNNNTRNRSATDQIMLNRMQSKGNQKNDILKEIEKQYKKEQNDKKEREASKRRYIQSFIVNLTLFISLILSGTLFFGGMNMNEYKNKNIIDSFRWSIVSVSTVGYGDYNYPSTNGGRLFATFFIIFGVSLLARLLNTVLDRASENYQQARLKRITNRKNLTFDNYAEFDEDGDGKISNYEFLKTMLIRRGDTTKQVIDEIMDLFYLYDQDGSGEIEVEEIKSLIRKKEQNQGQIENEEKQDQFKDITNYQKDNMKETKFGKLNVMKSAENLNLDLFSNNDEEYQYEYALTVQVRGCDNLKEADDLIAAEDSFWSFVIGWFGFIIYLIIGSLIFCLVEDANFGDMLWMFVVTTCTVGYGDIYPISKLGKILNAFFISISVVLFVSTFSTTFDYIYARQEALVKQKAINKNSINDMIDKFPLLSQALNITTNNHDYDIKDTINDDTEEILYVAEQYID